MVIFRHPNPKHPGRQMMPGKEYLRKISQYTTLPLDSKQDIHFLRAMLMVVQWDFVFLIFTHPLRFLFMRKSDRIVRLSKALTPNGTWQFNNSCVFANLIIQELRFWILLSFFFWRLRFSQFLCQFLLWEKIWEPEWNTKTQNPSLYVAAWH